MATGKECPERVQDDELSRSKKGKLFLHSLNQANSLHIIYTCIYCVLYHIDVL